MRALSPQRRGRTYPTQCNIPEDLNLQQHRCENLKPHKLLYFVKSTEQCKKNFVSEVRA